MKLLLLPSWVSLVRYIEAWQWLWRRRNEVGVIIALWPYLEWALGQGGTCRHTPSLFQLKTQDWSLAGCTVSTKYVFTVSTKYLLDSFLFSDSRHKKDYGDIEWEEQTASLISSVAAGSLFHCPLYWGVQKYSIWTAKKMTNVIICHY